MNIEQDQINFAFALSLAHDWDAAEKYISLIAQNHLRSEAYEHATLFHIDKNPQITQQIILKKLDRNSPDFKKLVKYYDAFFLQKAEMALQNREFKEAFGYVLQMLLISNQDFIVRKIPKEIRLEMLEACRKEIELPVPKSLHSAFVLLRNSESFPDKDSELLHLSLKFDSFGKKRGALILANLISNVSLKTILKKSIERPLPIENVTITLKIFSDDEIDQFSLKKVERLKADFQKAEEQLAKIKNKLFRRKGRVIIATAAVQRGDRKNALAMINKIDPTSEEYQTVSRTYDQEFLDKAGQNLRANQFSSALEQCTLMCDKVHQDQIVKKIGLIFAERIVKDLFGYNGFSLETKPLHMALLILRNFPKMQFGDLYLSHLVYCYTKTGHLNAAKMVMNWVSNDALKQTIEKQLNLDALIKQSESETKESKANSIILDAFYYACGLCMIANIELAQKFADCITDANISLQLYIPLAKHYITKNPAKARSIIISKLQGKCTEAQDLIKTYNSFIKVKIEKSLKSNSIADVVELMMQMIGDDQTEGIIKNFSLDQQRQQFDICYNKTQDRIRSLEIADMIALQMDISDREKSLLRELIAIEFILAKEIKKALQVSPEIEKTIGHFGTNDLDNISDLREFEQQCERLIGSFKNSKEHLEKLYKFLESLLQTKDVNQLINEIFNDDEIKSKFMKVLNLTSLSNFPKVQFYKIITKLKLILLKLEKPVFVQTQAFEFEE